MSMAWFNYGYTHARLVAYEQISFVTDRGYAPAPGGSATFIPSAPVSIATEREDNREREFVFEYDRDAELMERDYYEELELALDSREPDRYSWDQYDRGYYY